MLPVIVVGLLATPAFASDPQGPSTPASDATPPQTQAAETLASAKVEVVHMPADVQAPSRGATLPVLYGSFAILQTYDAIATLRGVHSGGVEINPMMAGVSRSPAAMWAVKAGVTTAAIVASERLWRAHRRSQAIVVMAIANGVMAGVALHNASVTSGIR
jgi:hypothetical protein